MGHSLKYILLSLDFGLNHHIRGSKMKCLIKIFALFVFISCTKSTDSDKNLVEVFANNKQAVSVEHQYIRKNPNLMIFTNDNDLTINKAQA